MDYETGEIHSGATGDSRRPIATYPRIRQLRFQKSGGVMVPQLGIGDDAVEMSPWHETEIPKTNGAAGEQHVQTTIDAIEQAKNGLLQAPTTLRKHSNWTISSGHRL